MILSAIRRTAIRWTLYAVAFVVLLSGINYGLSYLPFTPQWNAKRAAASAERLEGEVASLEATATGNAEIGQATETYHTREVIVREITAQGETEARSAPDATTPLSDERASRLRAADKRLCDATGLCPSPAPDAS